MQKKVVTIYSPKGQFEVPFKDATTIRNFVGDQKVLYVTKAIQASANEVVNIVKSLNGYPAQPVQQSSPAANAYQVQPKNEKMFLRAKTRGTITLPDVKLKFQSPRDYYSVDQLKQKFGDDVFEKSDYLRKFCGELKMLEVVPESKAIEYARKWQEDNQKREQKREAAANRSESDNSVSGHDDVITIDLAKNAFGRGGLPNESNLLPPGSI